MTFELKNCNKHSKFETVIRQELQQGALIM